MARAIALESKIATECCVDIAPRSEKRKEVHCESFEALFRHGDPSAVIALSEELLQARGGLFFEGHRGDAPPQWRKPIT